jgi:hypothetical protein
VGARRAGAAAARSARPSSSNQPALLAERRHQLNQTHAQQTLHMLRWTVQLTSHKRRARQRCVLWLSVHALSGLVALTEVNICCACVMHANEYATVGSQSSNVS